MPYNAKTTMNLIHQLKGGQSSIVIRIQNPDAQEIKQREVVKLLDHDSEIETLSSGGSDRW